MRKAQLLDPARYREAHYGTLLLPMEDLQTFPEGQPNGAEEDGLAAPLLVGVGVGNVVDVPQHQAQVLAAGDRRVPLGRQPRPAVREGLAAQGTGPGVNRSDAICRVSVWRLAGKVRPGLARARPEVGL